MLRVNVADVTVKYRTVEVPEVCPMCGSRLAAPLHGRARVVLGDREFQHVNVVAGVHVLHDRPVRNPLVRNGLQAGHLLLIGLDQLYFAELGGQAQG